jgi:hypothetical protein
MQEHGSLLEFPTLFPLKVMGRHADEFEAFVVAIVQKHAPTSAYEVALRPSRGGKYLAVTVTFVAESRAQLEAIYQELSTHERVLMTL